MTKYYFQILLAWLESWNHSGLCNCYFINFGSTCVSCTVVLFGFNISNLNMVCIGWIYGDFDTPCLCHVTRLSHAWSIICSFLWPKNYWNPKYIKYDFVDFLMALELSKLEICLLLIILMFPYILVNFFNIGWSLVFCYASSILILFCILIRTCHRTY